MTESQNKNRMFALDIAARTYGHHAGTGENLMAIAEVFYQFLEGTLKLDQKAAPSAEDAA
jgi:hypothetical protein